MKHDVGLQCSWSGNFFGIDFDESAIYTDITDAGNEEKAIAGVSTEVL